MNVRPDLGALPGCIRVSSAETVAGGSEVTSVASDFSAGLWISYPSNLSLQLSSLWSDYRWWHAICIASLAWGTIPLTSCCTASSKWYSSWLPFHQSNFQLTTSKATSVTHGVSSDTTSSRNGLQDWYQRRTQPELWRGTLCWSPAADKRILSQKTSAMIKPCSKYLYHKQLHPLAYRTLSARKIETCRNSMRAVLQAALHGTAVDRKGGDSKAQHARQSRQRYQCLSDLWSLLIFESRWRVKKIYANKTLEALSPHCL